MTLDPKFQEALKRIKLPRKPILKIPEMRRFDWLMTFFAVAGFCFGVFGVWTWYGSSHQITDLQNQNSDLKDQVADLKSQLDQAKIDLNQSIYLNGDSIKLAIYEMGDIGVNTPTRNNYFLTRFGISYDKAIQILDYSKQTDYFALGISSLNHLDYNSSLTYFDMSLIKDPTNIESNIGKAAALIGLNRTKDARNILFRLNSSYDNRAYIIKLIGDSYFSDGNYENATNYYLDSLCLYSVNTNFQEQTSKGEGTVFERIESMKVNGLYNSSEISISYYQNGRGKWISIHHNNCLMGYTQLPGPD